MEKIDFDPVPLPDFREIERGLIAERIRQFEQSGGAVYKASHGETARKPDESRKEQNERIYRQTTVLKIQEKRLQNLTGATFGQLKVLGEAEAKRRERMWLVQCSCGAIETAPTFRLTSGVKHRCIKCGYASKRKTKVNEFEARNDDAKGA